jgi:hypothetical protein
MLKDVKKLLRTRDLIIKTDKKKSKLRPLPAPTLIQNPTPLDSTMLDLHESQRVTLSEIDKSSD